MSFKFNTEYTYSFNDFVKQGYHLRENVSFTTENHEVVLNEDNCRPKNGATGINPATSQIYFVFSDVLTDYPNIIDLDDGTATTKKLVYNKTVWYNSYIYDIILDCNPLSCNLVNGNELNTLNLIFNFYNIYDVTASGGVTISPAPTDAGGNPVQPSNPVIIDGTYVQYDLDANFTLNTTYTITVNNGLFENDYGLFNENYTYTFNTRGGRINISNIEISYDGTNNWIKFNCDEIITSVNRSLDTNVTIESITGTPYNVLDVVYTGSDTYFTIKTNDLPYADYTVSIPASYCFNSTGLTNGAYGINFTI